MTHKNKLIYTKLQDLGRGGYRTGRAKYPYFSRLARKTYELAVFAVAVVLWAFFSVGTAEARNFSYLSSKSKGDQNSSIRTSPQNSQTIAFLEAALNYDPNPAKGGGDITIVDDSALLSDVGPSGTIADIESNERQGKVSLYVVRRGDTLPQIARMFDVSVSTILWANDLDRNTSLRDGQTLVILPIDGVQHTVRKGDTLRGIAKKYGGNIDEILEFNNLESDEPISVGDVIVVPDGKESASDGQKTTSPSKARTIAKYPSYSGYYKHPVPTGRKSQGIHGYNGVDYGAPIGTPIYASADGLVVVSRFRPLSDPWFGGYGNYVVIEHANGTQTLYGHMSAVYVSAGVRVSQGQSIGEVGNTGRSTGPHLHFEVRGARNPF